MSYTLPKKVREYIGEFAGRTWLLPKILDWYQNSYERLLLLTGDPGTGKSMVAAEVTVVDWPSPNEKRPMIRSRSCRQSTTVWPWIRCWTACCWQPSPAIWLCWSASCRWPGRSMPNFLIVHPVAAK